MKLTETQKNCKYCHTTKYGETKPICKSDGEELHVYPDGSIEIDIDSDGNQKMAFFSESGVFNVCPMCGRPLSKEVEP